MYRVRARLRIRTTEHPLLVDLVAAFWFLLIARTGKYIDPLLYVYMCILLPLARCCPVEDETANKNIGRLECIP